MENITLLQECGNVAQQLEIPCSQMPVDLISTINEGDIVIEAETGEGEDNTVIVLFDHDAANNKYDVNIIEIGDQPLFQNDIPDTPFVITDKGYMDFIEESTSDLVEVVPSISEEHELENTPNLDEALPSISDVLKPNLVNLLPAKYDSDIWNMLSCPVCNKTFKNPSSVVAHIIVHNGGKPFFICEICGKRSRKEVEHSKHMDKHNDPTLAVFKMCCQHCEMVFYRKHDFRKHIHGFHGMYRCGDCGQLFNRHTELVKHCRYNIKVAERVPCPKHAIK